MKRHGWQWLGLWILLAAGVAATGMPGAGGPTSDASAAALRLGQAFSRIDEFVERHLKEENAPGLALAVTTREGLLAVRTYGWADVKARVPVTPETRFEIGSISKSFTALALLQLREEGKLDLQAPVTKYLPWLRINSKFPPITIHHLLSHTAGLPRDRDDIPASRYQAAALAERWTGFAPGERFYYSNIGFQVLGYLLEELTGQNYAEAMRARIFEPLGMKTSEPVITHETRTGLAVGYERFYDDRPGYRSHPLVEATWLEYGGGDGSIAATPADLAAYLRMLLNRGAGPQGRVLSEGSFRLLTGRVIPMNPQQEGEKTYYGYGMSIRRDDGHEIISHSGGMVGYQAQLRGDLDAGLGVVVFINGPGNSGQVAQFALQAVRAALEEKEVPELPEPEDPTRVKNATDYAGTYVAVAPAVGGARKSLRLVAEGEKLLLEHAAKRIALERRGRDAFYVSHPDFALFPLRFGREGDPFDKAQGKKIAEVWYGADWYVNASYKGTTDFNPPKEWAAYPGHYRTTHPWFSNFRVLVRKGKLWLVTPEGGERQLVPLDPSTSLRAGSARDKPLAEGEPLGSARGEFRVGEEEWSPERIRLDTLVGGKALRATLSGCAYYRSFTP